MSQGGSILKLLWWTCVYINKRGLSRRRFPKVRKKNAHEFESWSIPKKEYALLKIFLPLVMWIFCLLEITYMSRFSLSQVDKDAVMSSSNIVVSPVFTRSLSCRRGAFLSLTWFAFIKQVFYSSCFCHKELPTDYTFLPHQPRLQSSSKKNWQ